MLKKYLKSKTRKGKKHKGKTRITYKRGGMLASSAKTAQSAKEAFETMVFEYNYRNINYGTGGRGESLKGIDKRNEMSAKRFKILFSRLSQDSQKLYESVIKLRQKNLDNFFKLLDYLSVNIKNNNVKSLYDAYRLDPVDFRFVTLINEPEIFGLIQTYKTSNPDEFPPPVIGTEAIGNAVIGTAAIGRPDNGAATNGIAVIGKPDNNE
jgi:hypothetical protein